MTKKILQILIIFLVTMPVNCFLNEDESDPPFLFFPYAIEDADGEDADEDEIVVFNDVNLENKIRDAIDKSSGSILNTDLYALTSFNAYQQGIADISGLEYAVNLTRLDLSNNQISDISVLSGLTSLTSLDLYRNQISDISSLSGLTSLTSLDLMNNKISDIQPLVNNTGLGDGDSIDIRFNQLASDDCVNLQTLIDIGVDVDHNVNCD